MTRLGVSVVLAGWCIGALSAQPLSAQEGEPPTLRLAGMTPGGVSAIATASWQTYDFELTNLTDVDRHARVLMYFPERRDVQYGRDVWVPARATLKSWLLVGPAPTAGATHDLEMQLVDRTRQQKQRVRPRTEENIRARGVNVRKRAPFTAVMLDEYSPEEPSFGRLPQPESRSDEALQLVQAFREARQLAHPATTISAHSLPPSALTFDSIDHFVLASNRIAHDPPGMQALRHWLARGGRVWVMLDMVDLDVAAPLLGEALDFHVVGRVALTTTKIDAPAIGQVAAPAVIQHHERPVDLVRVVLPRHETPPYTVGGWPIYFARTVGRGQVLFTTLGARGWTRPREAGDRPSPYSGYATLPLATPPLIEFAEKLQPPTADDPLRSDVVLPMLTEDIGFRVVNRSAVGLIFAGAILTALALGLALRRTRRPELLGWLAPAAAAAAAVVFVFMGEASRRAVPPTIACVQFVDAVAGHNEASVRGLIAVYRPDSGAAVAAARQQGFFELDMAGIEGQTRRLIMTDADTWHWDNLELPAGIRLAPFHATIPTKEPIRAIARFGPDGIEGALSTGPFLEPADALLSAPDARNLAVNMSGDGSMRAGSEDVLPPEQFLASAVLSDRQQRRQDVYRKLLARSATGSRETRDLLFAWARPVDLSFTLPADAEPRGSALVMVPVEWQRSAPGDRVTVPGPLMRCQRVIGSLLSRPTFEAASSTDMHLRFQAPAAVLPLKIERARLTATIDAPNRRVTIAGKADAATVELHRVESPLDVIRVDIDDPRLLTLDPRGGLHLHLAISDRLRTDATADVRGGEKWTIEYIEVEVTGTCQ
ncbi:MAG: hypothetical protein L0Y71_04985 [Gemmataceae bacterium]|nr:hypothetical protein [Gemmataceae bacterium]